MPETAYDDLDGPDRRQGFIYRLANLNGLKPPQKERWQDDADTQEELAARASGAALFLRMLVEQSDLNVASARQQFELKALQTPTFRMLSEQQLQAGHWEASDQQIENRYNSNGHRYPVLATIVLSAQLEEAGLISVRHEVDPRSGRRVEYYRLDPGLADLVRLFPAAHRKDCEEVGKVACPVSQGSHLIERFFFFGQKAAGASLLCGAPLCLTEFNQIGIALTLIGAVALPTFRAFGKFHAQLSYLENVNPIAIGSKLDQALVTMFSVGEKLSGALLLCGLPLCATAFNQIGFGLSIFGAFALPTSRFLRKAAEKMARGNLPGSL